MLFETTLNAELLVLSALKAVAAIPFRLTRQIPNALLPKNDVASLVPSWRVDFAREIKGFHACRNTMQGGRVCRSGHELPCPLCCEGQVAYRKKPENRRQKLWSDPCFVFGGGRRMCAADVTFGFEFCRRFPTI
ncbi:MAG: hypothetical protein ABI963_12480 [Rhizomicrobium sp.]